MVNSLIKGFVLLFLFGFFIACSSANNKPLLIDFSKDMRSIEISHIDPAGLLQLQQSKLKDSALNNLVYVLQTPSDQDSLIKELAVPGSVKITDRNLVFVPDHPFVPHRSYIVTTFLNSSFGDAGKMLKGKLSYGLKPYSKTLTR